MEREEEKEAEREEEEVAPEQRVETKHGQEEKKKEVLQALGHRLSRSPCWRRRARRYTPRDAAACSEPTQVQGRSVRRKEGVAEQSCGGTDRYRPRPLHLSCCGEVRTHA